MKQLITFALVAFTGIIIISCNTTTPEKYFDVAVLNTNIIHGFAADGQIYELDHPSVKLSETTGQPVPMNQKEVIEEKIKFSESMLKKLHGLTVTDDTKDIVQTSIALYTYILGAYKTDYMKLANLYAAEASKEKLTSTAAAIHERYFPRYDELYSKLISHGKLFAARHAIKVNWAM